MGVQRNLIYNVDCEWCSNFIFGYNHLWSVHSTLWSRIKFPALLCPRPAIYKHNQHRSCLIIDRSIDFVWVILAAASFAFESTDLRFETSKSVCNTSQASQIVTVRNIGLQFLEWCNHRRRRQLVLQKNEFHTSTSISSYPVTMWLGVARCRCRTHVFAYL
jgi:hypothetical protein